MSSPAQTRAKIQIHLDRAMAFAQDARKLAPGPGAAALLVKSVEEIRKARLEKESWQR